MNTLKTSLVALTLATLFTSSIAFAKDVTVKAEGTKFVDQIINVEPGDTVDWTNMDIHNVDFKFQPTDAKPFVSTIGKDVSRTFTKEGIYLYQCDPHVGLGMAGAVIVGKPTNIDDLKATKLHGYLHHLSHVVIKQVEK